MFQTAKFFINLAQKTPRIKDSVVLGLLSGLIGTIPMDIIDSVFWMFGKHEMLYGHLAGSMIFRPIRTNRKENFLIGHVMHLLTGSGLGYLITGFLKITGKDHHLIKGSFIGMLGWMTLYEFGQRVKWFTLKAHKSSTFYTAFLMNLVYGMTTAQAVVSLAHPSVFNNKKIEQNTPIQPVSNFYTDSQTIDTPVEYSI
ncbi:hypothetical protein Desor_1842 [Desulfosporosinus orientis DSM 765]|uniref:Uncharacterized protein n=1 Tax=Desulfosporosinus orientis (strain ATCC 19365 / DSM 765 / NCIMB 8382 / VKM B-1628 / Singapore I) TaxID=768706 RepID=G7WAX5_DESOD|nr:hypothetical protein [Desulfosporosinus orientis]AET67476.1 hypothetical protein Desor_1842 [Desulfosporosinus orientis DSM 765]